MSLKKILVISVLTLLLVFLVIFKILNSDKKKMATRLQASTTELPVDVFLVRDTTVTEEIETIGTLEARESVEIVSEISKKVTGIFMQEGVIVEKGKLLFKLDDNDIVAEIAKLKVEEELAIATDRRERTLLDKGGISQDTYDQVANKLKTIRAEIAILEVALSKTEIHAPFSGKIGLRNVSVGSWVTPSLTLADLQEIQTLKVIFSIPERYSGEVRSGQKVFIRTDRSPEEYPAIVEASEPAVDAKTRSLKVQALLSNTGTRFIPGISVHVRLELRIEQASLFVPTSALVPSQQGYSVYLVKNGKAERRLVKTGLRTASAVQILENLVEGDTLITTNLLRIKPEAHVRIVRIQ